MAGYHENEIPKGSYGDLSKIREEFHELQDAHHQANKILILNELADLIGAIKGYINKNFEDIGFYDVERMQILTHKAFEDGTRKAKSDS